MTTSASSAKLQIVDYTRNSVAMWVEGYGAREDLTPAEIVDAIKSGLFPLYQPPKQTIAPGPIELALRKTTDESVIRLIVGAKVNPAKGLGDQSAIAIATQKKASDAVIQLLLNAKAEPLVPVKVEKPQAIAQSEDQAREVPDPKAIRQALFRGANAQAIQQLLDANAQIEQPDILSSARGDLERAVCNYPKCSADVIQLLIDRGAKPTLPREGVHGTIVDALTCQCPKEIIHSLVRTGAKISLDQLGLAIRMNEYKGASLHSSETQRLLGTALLPGEQWPVHVQWVDADPAPQQEEPAEEANRSAPERSGLFGCIGAFFTGIWECFKSIFSGIAQLFSSSDEMRA